MNAFVEIRKKRGYSQECVAAIIGVERSTIAKWETGVAKPRVDNLIALSELYDCSIGELLTEAPTNEKKKTKAV